MVSALKLVVNFSHVDKDDLALVGGKGANLGEMTKAGFPIPPGFIVTSQSYQKFLAENKLEKKIADFLAKLDVENPTQLDSTSKQIQNIILKSKIPEEVVRETFKHYRKLSGLFKRALVAVRSSATAEDLPQASFAGQQASFLNIRGESNLANSIRECWASLFTPRAIFYRVQNKIEHSKVKIAVVVQKMIQSEASGVMFTTDPVTNQKNRIVIEAIWGLGDFIVQGIVTPDRYVIDKESLLILERSVSTQEIQQKKAGQKTLKTDVAKKLQSKQKIDDKKIVALAKIGSDIHKHYYFPQDIEWALVAGKFYIVQSRPITTTQEAKSKKRAAGPGPAEASTAFGDARQKAKRPEIGGKPILLGVSASPGIATGRVRIIKSGSEIGKVKEGDVLVTKMTSPDFVPAMKRAVAIITDEGGKTSHAAIVSRELGIPCVVGTKDATSQLKDGLYVTVDGASGRVFLGTKTRSFKNEIQELTLPHQDLKTVTKLYVNLAEPERAASVAQLPVDGVGLLRAEFMLAGIGIHPKEAVRRGKRKEFIENLGSQIKIFARAFGERPVVYRTTDFKTNEYRQLEGGRRWEPVEPNPLLGFRGAYRYITDPEVFEMEIEAIKKVREEYQNLWVMIPYVHSPSELTQIKRTLASENLRRSETFKIWMMVELPVNVILLEDFLNVGIDGVSIGSNDLTMLLLGVDRDNSEVQAVFDERSAAVSWAFERIIKSSRKRGVTTSICGQAPSTYDSLVCELVQQGITSISVNPDSVLRVKRVIAETERKILK